MRLVALDIPGGPAFVDALRAAWDAGDAVLPLPQRVPSDVVRQLVERLPVDVIRDVGGEHDVAHTTTRAATRAAQPGRVLVPGDALVIATSGSTGEPKGVVLTHDAVAASARATSAALDACADDHWLACLPLNHVGGLSVVTRALHTGTQLTVLPRFDEEAVATSPATLISLVTATLARVDHRRFRHILLGGAAPPSDRPANAIATYGMTETGSGVVYDGRPLHGVDVRIAAGDGDSGEIHLRGPMLLRCYSDGTSPLCDGWLPTGDIGHWLDDGRLHVDGRRGDLIITGGENVWPEPVERLLRTHPGIADVAVAGVADPEWGQQVVAYVVASTGTASPPSLPELRTLVQGSLPTYCAPRRLELVTMLPRTALGKLQRHLLVPSARS